MTKTLQKRFVLTAMLAVSVLLAVLLGAINVTNFIFAEEQISNVLSILTDGQGVYAPPAHRTPQAHSPEFRATQRPSPDDMMGARYFAVVFDDAGAVVRVDVSKIYAVTEDEARELAVKLYNGAQTGQYDQFRYRRTALPDERGSLMLFLDTSSQRDAILNVLLVSCGGGLLCWLAMLLLVILLSKRTIAPIARNIEKQKQFVTNAGHEIKTPLAIIMANTDAMELHNGENKWSRNIRAQTVRLNGLMQNLLTLARMDEAGETMPMSEFSFELLMDEALDLHRESFEQKSIVLSVQLQPGVTLRGNRDSVMQMVSVLLDNAAKYTEEGGAVAISLQKEEGKVCLRVSNPCRQPPEELERLFDRFYRGDAARTQSSGGYGIGLSAARAIAQSHGGNVRADYDEKEHVITFTATI